LLRIKRTKAEEMRHTLLHIEDDSSISKLVETAFDSFGFKGQMLSAKSVREGLTILKECARTEKSLSLILTDMRLPDGTGLEIIEAVKTNPIWRSTPVIVLSSEKADDIISNSYAMGANCYMQKIPRSGSMLKTLRSLYDCWLENAVFPDSATKKNPSQTILAGWISHRAQQAHVYMSLSEAFPEDSSLSYFWLNRALIEGNFTNMAVFFQRSLNNDDIPQDISEQFLAMQERISKTLSVAERFLKENRHPTEEECFNIVLDGLEALDANVISNFFHHALKQNIAASKAFRLSMEEHFDKIVSLIMEETKLPGIRERALALNGIPLES